jgi:2-hydroxy-3-oxopropionate reductase
MKLGFIGLGIMGAPMAGHLIQAGHELFVNTQGKMPENIAGSSATNCASAAEVARQADIIFTMVPDTPDVEAVLFGATGVAAGLSGPGKTVVDMSSISPMATKDFARRINELGCDYLDAPVSGGEVGARVANQIIVALNIAAVGEALLFASKAGADPARVREALMGGFAASRILEVHGERMIKRTFDPGFRIRLHQKDLNLALSGARELGVALPQTANAAQLMQTCAAYGFAELDHSALVRALEIMAAHEIGG